jgi:DNA recombination protein RmuC
METGLLIVVIISALLSGACFALVALFLKKSAGRVENVEKPMDLKPELDKSVREIQSTVKQENAMITGALRAQQEAQNSSADRLAQLFAKFMDNIDAKFLMIDKNNQQSLEKMRETVSEKLEATLNSRFEASFLQVTNRLEEINKTFTEIQTLSGGVKDLNRVLVGVKTRGTWGEVTLENLLSQILTSGQYEKQYRLFKTENSRVDFAVKMPGKEKGNVYLPIDAKFPIEDYARIVDASESADPVALEAAVKAFERRIKDEAASISKNYIDASVTTDFAIMYLPTEGLYAEAVKRYGLVEEVQQRHKVVICGPTTIAALLNSLQMGFLSLAMGKQSAEIGKLLKDFSGDFDKFRILLRSMGKQMGTVQNSLEAAEKRTEIIGKKLDKAVKISGDEVTHTPLSMIEGLTPEELFPDEVES